MRPSRVTSHSKMWPLEAPAASTWRAASLQHHSTSLMEKFTSLVTLLVRRRLRFSSSPCGVTLTTLSICAPPTAVTSDAPGCRATERQFSGLPS